MKKLLGLFLFLSSIVYGQYQNGEKLLKAMHDKYYQKYCQTIQFDQRTTRYVNDGTIKDTAYWYEWISYPDKFRIDFGTKYGGNCVVFKNDSSYSYRKNKLVKVDKNENDLLLLLGGMYFRKYEDVIARLKKLGYDLEIIGSLKLNGVECFVIGKEGSQQVWVGKKDLKVIGIKTKLSETDWLEIRFDAFKKSCNGFTETKVTALKNGKLEQKEEYLNLKTSVLIPDSIFNRK